MVACAEIEGTQIQSQPRIHRKFHVSLCYVCYICSKAFCFLFSPMQGMDSIDLVLLNHCPITQQVAPGW